MSFLLHLQFLLGSDHWGPLWDWIRDRLLDGGYISAEDLELFTLCDDPDEATAALVRAGQAQGVLA